MAKRLPTYYSHLTDKELREVDTTNLKPGDQEALDEEFGARNDILTENLKEKQSQVADLTLHSRVLSKIYKGIQKDIDYLAEEAHKEVQGRQSTGFNQGTPSQDQHINPDLENIKNPELPEKLTKSKTDVPKNK